MKKLLRTLIVLTLVLTVAVGFVPLEEASAATIKLNKTKVTVYAGKTTTLKIKGTSKKVTWKSSNKAVATVYKGKVTAKKAGTATITAKVSGKSYKCKVTVKKPYLNKKTSSLYVGKTTTLKLTGATVKSYTSKNTAVATVSKTGKVTAKKAGSAKIAVKDTKGRYYYCTVTVKNPYLNQTDIRLGTNSVYQMKITGATAKSWTSSNEKVATISSGGKITAHYGGTATITCTASNGKAYTAKVTVSCYNHIQSSNTETVKEPTCQDSGLYRVRCKYCDYYEDRYLSTVDHEHILSYTVPATCEDYGKAYYICKWCGGREYSTPYGSPTGHSYSYGGSVTASKAGPGYDAYICSNCDEIDQRNKVEYYPSANQVYNDMIAKKSSYPEGMSWTNSNYYGWDAGYYTGGYGCAGFAFMLSDAAFGYLPAKKHYDFDNIKPGDILRINNDGHSVVVLKIDGTKYTLAEGNFNSSIHWGRTMTLSQIKANGTYVMTRYPQ